MLKNSVSFPRTDSMKFFKTLNQRVNQYFTDKGIKRTGNAKLWFKTVIMFGIFLSPYFLLLTLDLPGWFQLLLTIIMGVGMAGVGMNVMHDANHGSFSSKSWINRLMGSSIYLLAGNVYNWKVQHNVLHHTYTNVHGHDEDLEAGRILRFSKHTEWRKHHKFQHYYSVLLYGLLTINWAITTDFIQMFRYMKRGLSYGKFPSPVANWSKLVVSKILYAMIWIIIPMLLHLVWWKVIIGFFVMHYTAGLILSIVFQLAHVMDEAEMPLPQEDGLMANTWAIHQLKTTVNFARKNKLVNWYTGGLNHQVEHHIFPNISHIHYGKIAKIVRETAAEFGLPYKEYGSMRQAITAHFAYLKYLGAEPKMA